jgi:hypothetical protein
MSSLGKNWLPIELLHYRNINFYDLVGITIFLIPLQVWTGPEGSRRARLPDFKTIDTGMW